MGDPAKIFDTLSYAKKLQKAGFTQEQAEVQAETFLSIVQEQLVSKRDMKELETTMRTDIAALKSDIVKLETDLKRDIKEMETTLRADIIKLERDMKEMETGLRHDMKGMELSLTKNMEVMKRDLKLWLGGTMGVSVSILATIIIIFTHIH